MNEFREVFYKLTPYQKECYLHTTIEKRCIQAMYCILSSIKKYEAINIFNDLLQKEKFAFNTLDLFSYKSAVLFETLFNQLNSQQKEDYKKHLEPKHTAKARFILRFFYPNNERNESSAQKRES